MKKNKLMVLQHCFLHLDNVSPTMNRCCNISFKRTLVSFLVFFVVLAAGQESRGIGGFPRRSFQVRGGSTSSPFMSRRPGSLLQGTPGQTTSSPFVSPGNKEQEDDVSTKEMIDSFLTRDSRNSFIGALFVCCEMR
jgi:hypothetical protein